MGAKRIQGQRTHPLRGSTKDDQILIAVAVAAPAQHMAHLNYTALIDTGAQNTHISPKIVREFNLLPGGTVYITPANGVPVLCYKYKIRLDILMPAEPETEFWGISR